MTRSIEKSLIVAFTGGVAIMLAAYAYGAHAAGQNGTAIFNFSATPSWISPGQSSTLSWRQPDSGSCTGTGFSTGGANGGSVVVTPSQTTTYTVTCDFTGSKSVTVTVSTDPPPSAPAVSLSVSPTTVTLGSAVLVSWSSSGAASDGPVSCNGADDQQRWSTTAGSGSQSVTPNLTGIDNFTLNCTNTVGTRSSYVTVNVNQPVFDASCSVNPTTANINQSVNWFASAWNGVAPYSFSWLGEAIDGMTGSSINASYATAGTKDAVVSVVDSSGYSGYRSVVNDSQICTGPIIASDSDTEDGGTVGGTQSFAKAFARSRFNDSAFGPADFHANPQNYCVEAHLSQSCDPNGTQFGSGSCPFGVSADLHSGSGYRAATSGDYRTVNGWTTDKYYGAVVWQWVTSSGQNITRQCSPALTVAASAPTASLSANPISITQGGSSTLTYSCTNATSASISSGVGSVNAAGGTVSVTPAATTAYTLTCTGAGGSATAQTTVTVSPPAIGGSCSVSPTSIVTGGTATWTSTASGGNGTYTYSWSGTDGLTGSGSSAVGSYATAGTKTASVTITSGAQSQTIPCSNSLTVGAPTISGSCSVSPTSIASGGSATWTSTASGGNGTYTYSWSGTDGLGGTAPSVTGTYPAQGTKTASVAITSGGVTNTFACSNSLTVGAAAQPDLTAGGVSPTSATAGTAATLSATVSNTGAAGTGAGFTNLFQRATDSAGTNATDIGTAANAALGASGSNSTALSYTFPSAATWYVRVCADKSAAGNAGVIAESNEGNNCGPWTAISVAAASQFTLSCSVDNANPKIGDTVTYTAIGGSAPWNWTASDGYPINSQASTAIRGFSSPGAVGMQVASFGYTTANCPVVTAGAAQCTGPSATISANPTRVRSGDTTLLSWSATGVDTSCVISGPGGNMTVTPNACNVAPSSIRTPAITAQSVYKINCDNSESTAQVIVNLIPKFIEF